jgi:protein-disulfide isomerase
MTTGLSALRVSMLLGLGAAGLALAGCGKKADTPGSSASPLPTAPATLPAGKSWSDIIVPTAEGGIVMGNPNAAVKLVEYGSLSCPHCAKLAQEGMAKIVGTYVASGKVSYEYRSFAIHPQDVPLTVLVRCGSTEAQFGLIEQIYGNFDAMQARMEQGIAAANESIKLPAAQRNVGLAKALGYTEFFAARGLPEAKANACLANVAAAEEVARQSEAITNQGINSTPTVLINGKKVDGAEWNVVEAALKAAGA